MTAGDGSVPRIPVFINGDVSYSAGEPVYDDGVDLVARNGSDGNWCGDASVASFILSATDVRFAFTSDSQFSGGGNRAVAAIAHEWPYTFSAMPVSAAAADPFFLSRGTPSQYLISSSWHNANRAVTGTDPKPPNGASNVNEIWSDNGIGNPSEIPIGFMWIYNETGPNAISGQLLRGNDQASLMYDSSNWVSSPGVNIRMHFGVLSEGESGLGFGHEFAFQFQFYNSDTGLLSNDTNTSITLPQSGSKIVELDAVSNSSAVLSMMTSSVVQSGEGVMPTSFQPRCLLRAGSSYEGKQMIFLPGWVERLEEDGITPEAGLGVHLVRTAAGRNPEVFLYGSITTSSQLNNHGGNSNTRQWMWENYGNPNVLFYSFGQNGSARNILMPRASSVWQADLFDLIWQDCHDYFLANGGFPRVVVHMPWAAANMTQDRHDEMVGVIDALNSLGVPTLGLDSFNRFGGSVFNNEFELDSVNIHPNDESAARIVWGVAHDLIMEAASCTPDINGDNNLDFFDISLFLISFSSGDFSVDFTQDGVLDFFDVSAFLAAFGTGCP